MSREMVDPFTAAQHLVLKLDARPGDLSISSFKQSDTEVLRVFLRPGSRYHKQDIPKSWEGFKVICEMAESPKASTL